MTCSSEVVQGSFIMCGGTPAASALAQGILFMILAQEQQQRKATNLHVCEYVPVVTPKVPRFRHVSGEHSGYGYTYTVTVSVGKKSLCNKKEIQVILTVRWNQRGQLWMWNLKWVTPNKYRRHHCCAIC